jgi:hypothetical protein
MLISERYKHVISFQTKKQPKLRIRSFFDVINIFGGIIFFGKRPCYRLYFLRTLFGFIMFEA